MQNICALERLYELRRGEARERYAGEIDELDKKCRELIAGIANANIRYSMFERYINGCTWDGIADKFGCGTADAVRKRCDRYLRSMSETA
ncbi:MAG: hypothetical protein IJH37_10225 [Clostridia bacterium]|nr:hypothetical protein [Clostridia bacterium]